MSPARSMSWWLMASASAGTSRSMEIGYWDKRMGAYLTRGPWYHCRCMSDVVEDPQSRPRGVYWLPNLLTTGALLAGLSAAAAPLRLARFNSRAASDKHYFEGLPSPSAAAIVAALIWLASDRVSIGLPGLVVAFVVTACAGALMISRFAFYSFKHVDASARLRYTQIVLVP